MLAPVWFTRTTSGYYLPCHHGRRHRHDGQSPRAASANSDRVDEVGLLPVAQDGPTARTVQRMLRPTAWVLHLVMRAMTVAIAAAVLWCRTPMPVLRAALTLVQGDDLLRTGSEPVTTSQHRSGAPTRSPVIQRPPSQAALARPGLRRLCAGRQPGFVGELESLAVGTVVGAVCPKRYVKAH
jgi:hypothetical protein